jgi:alkyl sulfatase BDS1-like metallo-beta-lactamase superfamily hydrolase
MTLAGETLRWMVGKEVKIKGKKEAFEEFLGLLDTFPFWFNIVTP